MEENNLFQLLLTALSPSAIYDYSWLISASFTFLSPIAFALSFAGQSLSYQFSLLKGDKPKLSEMWARSGSSMVFYMLFGVLSGLAVVVINGIYSMLDFMEGNSIIQTIFSESQQRINESGDNDIWDYASSPILFASWIGYYGSYIIYLTVSLFMKYAHAFLYAVVVITGPVFIALSAWKSSDFIKSWTKLLTFVIAWPIFKAIIFSLMFMIASGISDVFDNNVIEGSIQIKIILYTVLMILCFLLAATTIAVPSLTSSLLSGGSPGAFTAPFAIAGALAGKMLAERGASAIKQTPLKAFNATKKGIQTAKASAALAGAGIEAVNNFKNRNKFKPENYSLGTPPKANPTIGERLGLGPTPSDPNKISGIKPSATPQPGKPAEQPFDPSEYKNKNISPEESKINRSGTTPTQPHKKPFDPTEYKNRNISPEESKINRSGVSGSKSQQQSSNNIQSDNGSPSSGTEKSKLTNVDNSKVETTSNNPSSTSEKGNPSTPSSGSQSQQQSSNNIRSDNGSPTSGTEISKLTNVDNSKVEATSNNPSSTPGNSNSTTPTGGTQSQQQSSKNSQSVDGSPSSATEKSKLTNVDNSKVDATVNNPVNSSASTSQYQIEPDRQNVGNHPASSDTEKAKLAGSNDKKVEADPFNPKKDAKLERKRVFQGKAKAANAKKIKGK